MERIVTAAKHAPASLSVDPRLKRALLAALGLASPPHRFALHRRLARRLGFDTAFPHHVLERACRPAPRQQEKQPEDAEEGR